MEVFLQSSNQNGKNTFLLSTTILMEAIKEGAGREDAHAAIKEHAVAAVKDLRGGNMKENDLLSRLSTDKRITLSLKKLEALVKQGESRLGASNDQVTHFVKKRILGEISIRMRGIIVRPPSFSHNYL